MTPWEFRKLVRERRWAMRTHGCCPLGAASRFLYPRDPLPHNISRELNLEYGYALGIVGGFDASTPTDSPLPPSGIFDCGERYGRRMRIVAQKRGWRR